MKVSKLTSLTKYVGCEECMYKNYCEEFDPFFGCNNGRLETLTHKVVLTPNNDKGVSSGTSKNNS